MTATWSEVRFSGGMSLLASAPSCTHRRKWIRLHSKGPPALILGGKEAQGMHSQESESNAHGGGGCREKHLWVHALPYVPDQLLSLPRGLWCSIPLPQRLGADLPPPAHHSFQTDLSIQAPCPRCPLASQLIPLHSIHHPSLSPALWDNAQKEKKFFVTSALYTSKLLVSECFLYRCSVSSTPRKLPEGRNMSYILSISVGFQQAKP